MAGSCLCESGLDQPAALLHVAGALSDKTFRKVENAEQIAEVHVSDNDGRSDQHRQLRGDSFWLGWARERRAAGVPVIFECYLHRLTDEARSRQLELLEPS